MTEKQADNFALLMVAAVFIHNLTMGYTLRADSLTYLEQAKVIVRPPLYPLFLNLLRFLFGPQGLAMAALIQTLLAISAALFLARELRRHFNMQPTGFLFLLGILLSPLLPVTTIFVENTHISMYILSEALAYPVFLFAMGFMVKAIAVPRTGIVMAALLLCAAGTLIRTQLAFLWPVAACWLLLLWREKIVSMRRALVFGACSVLLVIFSMLATRLYHKVENGIFTPPPMAGWTLLRHMIYISSPQDIAAYPNNPDKELLEAMYSKAQSLNALQYQRTYPLVEHYNGNCNNIQYTSMYDVYKARNLKYYQPGPAGEAKLLCDLNRYSERVGKVLLKYKWMDYVKLVAAKTYAGFGWLDLLVLALALSGVVYRADRDGGLLLFMAAALVLANMAILLPSQNVFGRYTFYQDIFNLAVMATLSARRMPKSGQPS